MSSLSGNRERRLLPAYRGVGADLVERRVEVVIIVARTVAAQAVQARRRLGQVPIVIVADVARSDRIRPVTDSRIQAGHHGFSNMVANFSAKRSAIASRRRPTSYGWRLYAVPTRPWRTRALRQTSKAAAPALALALSVVERARPENRCRPSRLQERACPRPVRVDGPLFISIERDAGRLATQARLPAMYGAREFPGGRGNDVPLGRTPSIYSADRQDVDKILKGAKPSDLPIEQPTQFELGITLRPRRPSASPFPRRFLLRADEVVR